MANLSPLEKRQFEDLFGMSSGYVISKEALSNARFEEFFKTAANLDIFSATYNHGSGSKANRLRAFWDKEPDTLVGKVLHELLKVWEYENDNAQGNRNYKACMAIADRLAGKQQPSGAATSEDNFLEKDFGKIAFDKLPIEAAMIPVIQARYKEAYQCLQHNAPLGVIFLCGSMLEGILLGAALRNSAKFVSSASAPKKSGVVIPLQDWNLGGLIDVACDIGILGQDIKKFSHAMRDFRNYIHPYEQMSSGFNPDQHTAKICMQVLRAAIANLSGER